MAGKARIRFVARQNKLRFDRDTGHYNGANHYGMECLYCNEYFPNAKKPEWGGYVCKTCARWHGSLCAQFSNWFFDSQVSKKRWILVGVCTAKSPGLKQDGLQDVYQELARGKVFRGYTAGTTWTLQANYPSNHLNLLKFTFLFDFCFSICNNLKRNQGH